MDSQISARQRLSKHITTQTTIGESMMEYINTWLHSNIKSNDEKLLNYTNEACINIIITNSRSRDSCREFFKKLKFCASNHSIYFLFYYLWLKTENNLNLILEIRSIDTRYNNNFHYPVCNLTVFQKGKYYFGTKAFNNLPSGIKNLAHDRKLFSYALRSFVLLYSFYLSEEYFNFNIN
jgi:hypothetical protein